ncbi:MAG: hypothetical protein ACREVQ_07600 [Burkholderiales bacterium]
MRSAILAGGLLAATNLYAGYPLITEDTGTSGAGGWQLEGVAERQAAHVTGVLTTYDTLALSHGLGERVDVQGVLPWYQGGSQGVGDPEVNLKWRFYEHGAFSAGVKPAVTLPAGDPAEGTGTGKATWAVTVIGSYVSGPLAVNADLKYLRNLNTVDERTSIKHGSVGVLYRVGPVRLVADYTRETPTDPAIDETARYRVLGLLWQVRRDFGLGFGWKRGSHGAAIEESWIAGASLHW